MSARSLRPTPLLLLVLCWLLAGPALGAPVRPSGEAQPRQRDLEESASGDDLISGTDFLSVFIGAAMPPSRRGHAHARSEVAEEPEQNLGAFGARLIPKPKGSKTPPPTTPPPDPQGRFQDLSNSKAPSAQIVSFDPSDSHHNPLPEASARVAHRVAPGLDFQTESLVGGSAEEGTTSNQDVSEYYSQIPTEDSATDTAATTSRGDLVDLAVSDVEEEKAKSDVTIITEVVTSREELVPSTEATSVVSEHEAQASVQYPADEQQDSVAATAPSVESSPSAPPPPPPPPVQQVVSVRVSSSVVQGPSPAPHAGRPRPPAEQSSTSVTKQDGLALTPAAPASDEEMQRQMEADANVLALADASPAPTPSPAPAEAEAERPSQAPALVTEDRPANIAVQRSEFSVEEASSSSSELNARSRDEPFHKTVARVVEVSRNAQNAPVSYQTSVSSATSGSRVHFYSEPPSYRREMPSNVAESIRTSVVTSQQHVRGGGSKPTYEHVTGGPMAGTSEEAIESRMGRYGTPHHEVRISTGAHERVSYSSEVRSSQEGPHVPAPARDQKSFRPAQNPERNYEAAERTYAQPERNYAQRERTYSLPEQNYEVDEAVSVMSNGRAHGVQLTTPSPSAPPDAPPPTHAGPSVERAIGVLDTSQGRDPNHKFGYVVEGRNFRKYRVEERTPDGFIVGEYGVVSHDDGTLRGVRYTADGTINPQLIYEALVKFLSL